jgi:hypothetical protein
MEIKMMYSRNSADSSGNKGKATGARANNPYGGFEAMTSHK